MRFPLASLRSRAIGLVLLAILPLLALTFSSYLDQRDREIREVQQDALTAAKNLAVIQETLISSTKRLLMTLSRMPEVQKFDRAGGNALFARMMEENPYLNDIIAVNLQGRLFASAPPAHAPLNYSDRLWFKKVLETKTFSTGELVKGRLSGRYTLGLAYPIANRQGDLQGVVRAGTNLEWWGNLLTQMGFTPDTAVVFSDSSQKVLFRYPDPEKYLGQMLPEALRKAMAVSNAGVAEGVGLPGDPRLFAFARLAPPWQDMWVSIGLPKDVAVGPAKRALKQNLVFLFLVAFLALAAAWYFGEFFVIRPVRGLLGVTKRLAAGDLTVRAGAAYQKGELGLLASSFDQMAASLQKRDTALEEQLTERKQAEEALRQLNEELENRVAVRTGELNQEKQNLRHLAAKLITAREEERGRLSRDLHDDFGQSLLVLSMQLNAILKRDSLAPETREQFKKAVSYLVEVTNKVRRFSQDLSPPSLEQLGPTEALRELFEEFQEYPDNLIISADLDEVKDILPLEADITIYRIVQEFLTNAHKHANATQLAMAMKVLPGKVTVSLKDNGRGFDLEEIKNRPKDKRGLGLASVEERLKMLGSPFSLTSRPGEGTSLYFEIVRPPAEKSSKILAF